jgi:hypothetical protein
VQISPLQFTVAPEDFHYRPASGPLTVFARDKGCYTLALFFGW